MEEVSVWRKNMGNALAGIVMGLFTLNFLGLNYILSTVGILLMLTGFRALRHIGNAFRACYICAVLKAVFHVFFMVLAATIYYESFQKSIAFKVVSCSGVILTIVLLLCLRSGLRGAQESVGIEPHTGAITCMALVNLLFLTQLQIQGLLIVALVIVGIVVIVKNAFALVSQLDEAGYAVEPAQVRIPDGKLCWGVMAVLFAGIACGYIFFHSYPMQWQRVEEDEHAGVLEIKARLVELGFPDYVLQDMTAEDILACEGAVKVTVMVEDNPIRDHGDEVRITGVGVRLPGEREQWKLIHHFWWMGETKFYGTEALQLWPADRSSTAWDSSGDFTGRVLYDDAGITYAAPYDSLDDTTYLLNSIFWGTSQQTDVFAAFSMPRGGEGHRGYVSYCVREMSDGHLIDSWVNYVHQTSWFQYPVQTAMSYRINGGMFSERPFRIVQDALQFRPEIH